MSVKKYLIHNHTFLSDQINSDIKTEDTETDLFHNPINVLGGSTTYEPANVNLKEEESLDLKSMSRSRKRHKKKSRSRRDKKEEPKAYIPDR